MKAALWAAFIYGGMGGRKILSVSSRKNGPIRKKGCVFRGFFYNDYLQGNE
jgi:hypothetical protein